MSLPATVKSLGLVSLLTDASSEMIYPLLPGFLTGTLKAGPAFVGLVEGSAEAVASLLKAASGWISDRLPRRKPLVLAGYLLSSVVRPLVSVATAPWHVLATRLSDRVGKGVRSAPRDALLAEVTPIALRGRAFGFHRAMDHAGAVVGPLLASALLLFTSDLRVVFALAWVPASLSVLILAARVREPGRQIAPPPATHSEPVTLAPVSVIGSRAFRSYLIVLAVFSLGNSTDAFLLLRAQEAGVSLGAIPLLWSFHHMAKATASTHAGSLSDKLGRRASILAGWALYAFTYAGFAMASSAAQVWGLFAVYGLFYAFTEGPERALVADLSPPEARGRAFGLYHAVTGGMLLLASLITGALWERLGASAALMAGAGLATVAALGLVLLVPEPRGSLGGGA